MSEAPATPAKTAADKAEPRARRISNPRPKKSAKSAKPETKGGAKAESEPTPAAKFPEFPSTVAESPAAARSDWPEPEPATSGGGSGPENPKRKRRRKKGKGGGQSPANAAAENESPDESSDAASTPVTQPAQQQARPNQAPRVKLDAEQLAKFAWKIYLAEVSEEGVALIGDNDARELSRRCFRLAEIFLEEQTRRR
ncbi:MAG: hypothetical protein NTU84_08345 [Verrucomicrobia bacterium]|nr:hypothetical protein [Verrucomicrobiota bacterium]